MPSDIFSGHLFMFTFFLWPPRFKEGPGRQRSLPSYIFSGHLFIFSLFLVAISISGGSCRLLGAPGGSWGLY